jgi:hypothetical protein
MYSCPVTIGTGTVRCAQASQAWMWTSVPQMEVLRIPIKTSFGPTVGSGASNAQIPSRGSSLARLNTGRLLYATTPSSRPTRTNASTARSRWARVWAADSCVRMRAWPRGTTGNEKPTT